jgi:hypothetical protein
MIDYLWKELELYLPSIMMKAIYIMELNLESIMLSHV